MINLDTYTFINCLKVGFFIINLLSYFATVISIRLVLRQTSINKLCSIIKLNFKITYLSNNNVYPKWFNFRHITVDIIVTSGVLNFYFNYYYIQLISLKLYSKMTLYIFIHTIYTCTIISMYTLFGLISYI